MRDAPGVTRAGGATAPDGGGGSKRGIADACAPLPFQEQCGQSRYENPNSKIHNAKHGNRRPTPDKALPRNARPGS